MHKNDLDEMQNQKRNKAGNQAFMLLFYLLLIDMGLYGFGFRWLQYPVNVFIIMITCMTYYLFKVIWDGAYIGPKVKSNMFGKRAVFVLVLSGLMAALMSYADKKGLIMMNDARSDDNGALVLLIFSTVSIVIAVVAGIIVKRRDKASDE